MQEQINIIECYNKTAENYADKFLNELDHKHFDRIILMAFCEQNRKKGQLIDLGCGPGHTTYFIYKCGLENVICTYLSDEMVKVAKLHNPKINFEQADLLNLKYKENTLGSAIAFYAIVHFDYSQIKTALTEVHRILVDKGEFMFSFHIGNEIVHLDNFLDKEVNIKFQFFEVDRKRKSLF